MPDYVANVPISRPINLRIDRHRDLNGFSWNADEGLFIPIDDEDTDLFELPPEEQIVGGG